MIAQTNLPELLIPLCVDVLSKISEGERDLIRVIVDVIMEIRFEGAEDDLVSRFTVLFSHILAEIGFADMDAMPELHSGIGARYSCSATHRSI